MDKIKLREKLAEIEHERWADWQRWVHDVYNNPTQRFEVAIKNWERQIKTPYSELSDKEKASDMEQVDRYWHLIDEYIDSLVPEPLDDFPGYNEGFNDCRDIFNNNRGKK